MPSRKLLTEDEESIRQSTVHILSFLASVSEQRKFAAKVTYACYQDEFACWLDGVFVPEDPKTLNMFNAEQFEVLKEFSDFFYEAGSELDGVPLTIEQLQSKTAWQRIVARANEALTHFQDAIQDCRSKA
jgi:hypothetical protein